jgi:hypothetical protein
VVPKSFKFSLLPTDSVILDHVVESRGKPHLVLFISEVLVLTLTNCWRFSKYDLKRFVLFVKGIKMIFFVMV